MHHKWTGPVVVRQCSEDVGFYDNAGEFRVEPGTIEVFVGNSSAATMTASFTVA